MFIKKQAFMLYIMFDYTVAPSQNYILLTLSRGLDAKYP